jgi:hypothetical protein
VSRKTSPTETQVEAQRELEALQHKIRSAEVRLELRRDRSVPGLSFLQERRLALEPDYVHFRKRKIRRSVQQIYGRLLDSIDLVPEKRDRLLGLLEEKLFVDQDAKSLAAINNLSFKKTSESQTISQTKAAIEDEIFNLLGAELFHRYRTAPLMEKFESRIVSLEGRFEDQGLPMLTDEQRKSLREAYRTAAYPWIPGAERNKALRSGDGLPDPDGARLDTRVEQLSSTVLLPEQLASLKAYHSDSRAQEEISKRIASAAKGKVAPAR